MTPHLAARYRTTLLERHAGFLSSRFAAAHAPPSILIPFLDWSLQPHLDQPEDVPVRDAHGDQLEKFGMRNGIEVLGQVSVHHIGRIPFLSMPWTILMASSALF